MNRYLDVASSLASSVIRGGAGRAIGTLGPRPEKPLELYEFEGCPFCRKVREALSMLDLSPIVYPCPKGGPRFRVAVEKRGGRAQFPYLVDPNTGAELYESDDIVSYLFDRYGAGKVPLSLAMGPVTTLGAVLAGAPRPGLGTFYQAARESEQLLELYSFEASPFCRIVRERLCTLELPYRLHNVAAGSPGRDAFRERAGRVQVPYLVDPNTGAKMFESADIVAYLTETYAH